MDTQTISFRDYLKKIGHTEQSIRSYLYAFNSIQKDLDNFADFSFKNVIDYLSDKSTCKNKSYLLNGLKKYFDYLIEIGHRDTHPCKSLFIRNLRLRGIIHQDLFSSEELELLMIRKERFKTFAIKHRLIISLLIYQGLRSSEICQLKVNHINLSKNYIFIKESKKISSRHIPINPRQKEVIEEYLLMIKQNPISGICGNLLTGKQGKAICVDSINYLIEIFRPMFPNKILSASTIRKSVIANWLNENKLPLEQVQILAGQKWTSSTAIYRQENYGEQRELMNKWFPL